MEVCLGTGRALMLETAKEKVFDLILAIMYFVVAGVEGFVFLVGVLVSTDDSRMSQKLIRSKMSNWHDT